MKDMAMNILINMGKVNLILIFHLTWNNKELLKIHFSVVRHLKYYNCQIVTSI